MAYEYKAVRRVEFSETDMAGIVHFSNFFRYMETAEHGFYRALGLSVIMNQFDPPIGFPRVHASCEFKKPLRFEDEVEIHMLVKEKRSRVLTYLFRFSRMPRNGENKILVATGQVTTVCVAHHADGRMEATAIPAVLGEKIAQAPAELLQV